MFIYVYTCLLMVINGWMIMVMITDGMIELWIIYLMGLLLDENDDDDDDGDDDDDDDDDCQVYDEYLLFFCCAKIHCCV